MTTTDYFLVIDGRRGGLHVFLQRDGKPFGNDPLVIPRGRVRLEGVPPEGVADWAEVWLGQDPDDDRRYRVFRTRVELSDAEFHPVKGPLVLGDWDQYHPDGPGG
jgi:hypothetical protein